jgi:hypothetical protein
MRNCGVCKPWEVTLGSGFCLLVVMVYMPSRTLLGSRSCSLLTLSRSRYVAVIVRAASIEICSSYCAGSFNGVFVHDTVEVDSLCVTTVKGGARWGSLTDFFVDHCEFVGSCF